MYSLAKREERRCNENTNEQNEKVQRQTEYSKVREKIQQETVEHTI